MGETHQEEQNRKEMEKKLDSRGELVWTTHGGCSVSNGWKIFSKDLNMICEKGIRRNEKRVFEENVLRLDEVIEPRKKSVKNRGNLEEIDEKILKIEDIFSYSEDFHYYD